MSAPIEMVNKVLSGVAAKFKSRDRQLVQSWEQLIVKVCDGAAKEAEAVEALEKLGRTPKELAAACERLVRRREARGRLDHAKTIPDEMRKAEAAIAKANAEYTAALEAAKRRNQESGAPHEARLAELSRQAREAEAAEAFLRDTADLGSESAAELAELNGQLSLAKQRRDEANSLAAKARREAGEARHFIEETSWSGQRSPVAKAQKQREAEKWEAEEQSHRPAAEAAAAECRDLQTKIDAIEAQALAP